MARIQQRAIERAPAKSVAELSDVFTSKKMINSLVEPQNVHETVHLHDTFNTIGAFFFNDFFHSFHYNIVHCRKLFIFSIIFMVFFNSTLTIFGTWINILAKMYLQLEVNLN